MCVLRNGKILENYGGPYIIAEVNSSHNGNLDEAKRMIDAAKECGASCVKFQSWSSDSLYSKSYYDKNPLAKRFFDKFALSSESLLQMAQYAKSVDMDFSSTPYSTQEVDFLVDIIKAPFVKIASMELNNYAFLEYIGKKQTPIIISTGMGSIDEIKTAIKILESTNNKNIAILHCVSIYPSDIESMNLNNITMLKETFKDYAIGFSDHTKGSECAMAAVALGACVIEKHLSLDSKKIGFDNEMATEPKEFKELVKNIESVYKAMGSYERILSPKELEMQGKMRRSIVAAKPLKKGDVIRLEDLCAKRPAVNDTGGGEGRYIPPSDINLLVGKKVLKDIESNTQILKQDIKF
ncbi:N-acylneuraminate-9-phosphate synthase [Helicobacter saguini]|uniref:N-acetylneuraminate synthase family protein n=1 Tax=Helicobacter saguini TaxID=1548018 RepID=UPI000E570422|nr:N-acetylneuraminate synthase family protein [Helicobacter saguini]MWV62477.1 N-acylneuraminate-9-phosphate synthase [Helicobacter saguini]